MVIFILIKTQQFNITNFLYYRHILFDRVFQVYVSERGWSHIVYPVSKKNFQA
jgi:hypothetical protein